MLKKHPTPLKVDNWGVRFPTLVDDVSRCLKGLLDAKRADKAALTGIFHCSSPERATKYEQALLMADVLGVPASHLSPDGDPPASPASNRCTACSFSRHDGADSSAATSGAKVPPAAAVSHLAPPPRSRSITCEARCQESKM